VVTKSDEAAEDIVLLRNGAQLRECLRFARRGRQRHRTAPDSSRDRRVDERVDAVEAELFKHRGLLMGVGAVVPARERIKRGEGSEA
jgi:hypothetical protein